MFTEEPKTYCDRENGCIMCDLLFCDGSRKKEDHHVRSGTDEKYHPASGEHKLVYWAGKSDSPVYAYFQKDALKGRIA